MTAEQRLHCAWDPAGSQNDLDREEAEVFRSIQGRDIDKQPRFSDQLELSNI